MLALSGHGYGHLAQCAPVINALWQELPALRVTVCSTLPHEVIAGRLDQLFTSLAVELDVLLPMSSAWEVNVSSARQAYRKFHQGLDTGLQNDADLLDRVKPDLVLADIPYRILLAAKRVGVPAVGLCSLNWASIYATYCGGDDGSDVILEQMWAAYRAAELFLAPAPAIDMPELGNYRSIGPVARRGERQSAALHEYLGVSADTRLVMIAMGGISTPLPVSNWPRMKNVAWLFSGPSLNLRDDMIDTGDLAWSFIDVLTSSDAVLTKPGYGTYTEAVCNGVPILTLERPDWPETPCLDRWANRYGRLQSISKEQFEGGMFAHALERLWQQPVPDLSPEPLGIQQAAGLLLELLSGH